MKYNWKKGLIKGVTGVVIFAIPVLINKFPTLANLTISGLGIMFVNFIKIKYWK